MSLSSELSEYHDMVSQAVVVLDRDLKGLEENTVALQGKCEELEGNLQNIKNKVIENQSQSTLGLSTHGLAKLGAGSGVIALAISILALVL